ncbi:hypothetical protein [Mesonia sp.]|uniref:hypothetical protein n=1 Tax=Mesonia sp. TaxID=1960830 RepID=UPI003F9BA961
MKNFLTFLIVSVFFLHSCSEDKIAESDSVSKDLDQTEVGNTVEESRNENLKQQSSLVQIGEFKKGVYSSYDDVALREAFEDALEELNYDFDFDFHQFIYDDVNDVLTFNVGSDDGTTTGAFDVILDVEGRMWISSTFTFSTVCHSTDCASSSTGCQVQKRTPDDGTRWCSKCPNDGKCSRTSSECRIAKYFSV